jgi:phosphatidate cytidylyltransferase
MLKTRIITSIFLAAGLLGALFLTNDFVWALIMLTVVALGAWEWGALAGLNATGKKLFVAILTLAMMACLPGIWPPSFEIVRYALLSWIIFISTIIWLVLVPILLLKTYHTKRVVLLLIGTFMLLGLWLSMLSLRNISPTLLLVVMATVWIADSAA